jgi:NADH:ubiquinone oxidoreductase subunit C
MQKLQDAGLLAGREEQPGCVVAVVKAADIVKAAELLRSDAEIDMDLLMDLAGADYQGFGEARPGRFCVSYQFVSSQKKHRAWLKVYLDGEQPSMPSLIGTYRAANWYEREVWDMYGVRFEGHPYLKRVLLYEEFEGHPLRKDYPILKMQPLIPMRDAVDYEDVEVDKRLEKK